MDVCYEHYIEPPAFLDPPYDIGEDYLSKIMIKDEVLTVDFYNVVVGCLDITKIVDLGDTVNQGSISETFEICITGPSYPSGDCQTIDIAGGVLSWTDLLPGTYTITETNPGPEWIISGDTSVVVDAGTPCATATVTNTYDPGCLDITKIVNFGDTVNSGIITETFEICITGPSYPSGDCQTISEAGGTLNWNNLIPGTYTITETDPGPEWIVTGDTSVVVNSGAPCATATVINTYNPGCLRITKHLDWNGLPPPQRFPFDFFVEVNGPNGFYDSHQFSNDGEVWTLNNLVVGEYIISEDDYSPDWTSEIITSPVQVTAGDDICQIVEIYNTYHPGCLRIIKTIDFSGMIGDPADVPDVTFTVTVTGPSYPTGYDLTFNLVDGVISPMQQFSNIIPGSYDITETPPAGWDLDIIITSPEIVEAGDECGTNIVEVVNTPQLGCLEVEKFVDFSSIVGDPADVPDVTFTITVTGPSYPGGLDLYFDLTDGIISPPQQLPNIIPGSYDITETPRSNINITRISRTRR